MLTSRPLLQDAFGPQPVRQLLAEQGLDERLQLAVLHGVLLADGPVLGGSSAEPRGGAELTAAEALERLRVFTESVGTYGPDTGKGRGRATFLPVWHLSVASH